MDGSLSVIVGFVDTFAYDAARKVVTFSGWAVDEARPANELELFVLLDGVEHTVDVQRYPRPDLGYPEELHLGYTLTCSDVYQDSINLQDAIGVYARNLGILTQQQRLKMGDVAIEQVHRQIWLSKIGALNEEQVRSLISQLFPKIREVLPGSESGDGPVPLGAEMLEADCTKVYLPSGYASFDGSCILGGMGHAFLVGGSNNVLENYQVSSDSPQVIDQGNRWTELFNKRHSECLERGILYLQTVIPEKISLMPELVHFEIQGPTKLLSLIETTMARSSVAYISGYDTLAKERKFETFDAIDTHLSPFGAFRMFKKLIESAGIQDEIHPIFRKSEKMMVGDVAERFIVNSTLLYPDTELLKTPHPMTAEALRTVEEFDPSLNGHIGLRRVFENPLAPVKKKLLVFGNSFFERGGHPKTLTWWFARMFSELHFVWEPVFDWGYVDRIGPDIVIGQTIERFLTRLPQT